MSKNTGDWIWDLTLAAKKYRAWESFVLEKVCPKCASKEHIEQTAVGQLSPGPDHVNRYTCMNCKCRTQKGERVLEWLKAALAKVPAATDEPDPS